MAAPFSTPCSRCAAPSPPLWPTCLLGLGQTGYAAGGGANAAQGFVDGSRYGYMFGLVLVAIVLVFSFMLKGGKEEPKLVPVQVDDGAVESLAV